MKNKNRLTTILLVTAFSVGLILLLYPTVSDYWNSFHQTRAIANYAQAVANLDQERYDQLWEDAKQYNKDFPHQGIGHELTGAQKEAYEQQLDVTGDSIMGYIEIPRIRCALPIYHGTDEAVLQIAVGHLEWSSLPVGGKGSHCVLSGHRGLPSAKLFTDLDRLTIGDTFMLRVLDEVLTYEVDQILIVEPHETQALDVVEGQDLCTLITCTPYGINSHRLLVRGHRVDNAANAQDLRVTSDAALVDPTLVALGITIPVLLILLTIIFAPKQIRKLPGLLQARVSQVRRR